MLSDSSSVLEQGQSGVIPSGARGFRGAVYSIHDVHCRGPYTVYMMLYTVGAVYSVNASGEP